jgi:anti-sigma factor RsiW
MLSYDVLEQLATHRLNDLLREAAQARLARQASAGAASRSTPHLLARLSARWWIRARGVLRSKVVHGVAPRSVERVA